MQWVVITWYVVNGSGMLLGPVSFSASRNLVFLFHWAVALETAPRGHFSHPNQIGDLNQVTIKSIRKYQSGIVERQTLKMQALKGEMACF